MNLDVAVRIDHTTAREPRTQSHRKRCAVTGPDPERPISGSGSTDSLNPFKTSGVSDDRNGHREQATRRSIRQVMKGDPKINSRNRTRRRERIHPNNFILLRDVKSRHLTAPFHKNCINRIQM
jgi:hypothetical protein